MKYEIKIAPMGKPRMVRSDSWKKRPAVLRYWAFKDELVRLCREAGYVQGHTMFATFYFEMPKSWTKKKRLEKNLSKHDQKSDLDNTIKACGDCLLPEGDEKIHTICANKLWAESPSIVFYDTLEEWIADIPLAFLPQTD